MLPALADRAAQRAPLFAPAAEAAALLALVASLLHAPPTLETPDDHTLHPAGR